MNSSVNSLNEIQVIEDLGIVLSDGCRLSAKVWLPITSSEEPVPVVLEYIPYRKRDGTIFRDQLIHPHIAAHGYASIRVDMRGSGDSEGVMLDEYTTQELNDAVEVINWLATQPWSTGSIGMMGKSWGGLNSLQVASLAPEPLKAIVSGYTSTKRFSDDIHYKGGCLLNDNLRWAAVMLAYSARPPDPEIVGTGWREMWLERLENEPFLVNNWLSHQTYDDYWKHGSVSQDYSKIRAAVLAFGGWADNYMNAVPQLVTELPGPVKGIIGPWVHQYPHMAAPSPQIDFLNELIRWWDHWLKGVNNGVENDPALIYYLQDSVRPKRSYNARPGTWLSELDLPSDRVEFEKFYLTGSNKISFKKPQNFKVSLSSPTFCGLTQGEFFPMSLAFSEGDGPPELPGDQRADDAYSACFDTEVLDASIRIVGRAVLTVKLVSSVAQTQIAVRLCDVHLDGASTKICHGLLNLSHRNSDEKPETVEPGSPVEVRVVLDETAYNLPPGHKLRIAISNSYWPFVWPAAVQSTINIMNGSIDVPIHQSVNLTDEYSFKPPKELEGWEHIVLREGSYNKVIQNDLSQNSITIEINSDAGRVKDSTHHLVTDQVTKEVWSINAIDPLSAKGLIEWTQEISRNDWVTAIDTNCSMSADENYFYIRGSITAKESDKVIFNRDFNHTIMRNFK